MTPLNAPMILQLSWRLPRTAATVSMLRRVLTSALRALGITEECRYDLVLALTEACSNAVQHARIGPDYRVVIAADTRRRGLISGRSRPDGPAGGS